MADAEVSAPAPETATLPSELPVVPLRETVVLPMSRYLARKAAKERQEEEKQAEAESAEIELLREIRDELVALRGRGASSGSGPGT